jgi:4-amino-4-deoxy-L-arabinose transferase-like glycosyltransferase
MNENTFFLRKDGTLLFLIILIHIACWFAMKPVFPKGDPLVYFINAKRILAHEYVFSHSVQSHRYGIFIPQVIFIRLFGESPYIINLWTLICSLSTISLTYFFLLKFINRIVAAIGGLLLSVNILQIIYSSIVFPDNIVSFFALCSIYFICLGRREQQHWLRNSLLFITSFALGFATKESIVVILPFIAFIFWKDKKEKNFSGFQKSVSMLLIVFAIFLAVVSKILTSDFMFFYKSYSYYTVFAPLGNFTELLNQISFKLLFWFNSQLGYIFLLLFSIPAFINGIIKKDKFNSLESFISLYAIILLLSLWCGSISISNFGFIPLVDRRWMTLVVPLCILSATTIHGIIQNRFSRRSLYFLIVVFLLMGVFNSMEFTMIRGALFFAFAWMLVLQDIVRKKIKKGVWIRAGLILLPFFILTIQFLRTNSNYVVPLN